MKFNDKLMKLRKENSLSQEELAEKLGVTRQTISKWELGQTTPDMDKLSQISNVFGVTVDELLNETEDINQNNSVKDTKKKGKNIIIIVLVAVILILLGTSVITSFNNKNDNKIQTYNNEIREEKKNTGIFGWIFDILDEMSDRFVDTFFNLADKMSEKAEERKKESTEEWEERVKQEQEDFRKEWEEKANQVYEDYKGKTDEMWEELEDSHWNSVDKMMDKMEEYQKK